MAYSMLRLKEPTRLQVFGRSYRARLSLPQQRGYADDAVSAEISAKDSTPGTKTEWFFVDALFPVQLSKFDIRHHFANLRKEAIIQRVKTVLENTSSDGFKVLEIEPRIKDGGVFVHFEYISPLGSATPHDPTTRLTELKALADIQAAIQAAAVKHGGIPSWLGFRGPRKFWLVRGRPWREDMDRFASSILKTEFDGPDVHPESLYDVLRPYGRITKLDPPTPAPAGVPRSATVTYSRVHAAVLARNCLHGVNLTTDGDILGRSGPGLAFTTPGVKLTRLSMLYEQPLKEHAIRNWITSHPRIVLPVLAFLIGSLTYAVFDPIRELSVQGKMMNWFDYKEYALYKWLRENTYDRIAFTFSRAKREELLNVLAEWAAKLVEDKIAHVVFVCVNRENTKRVAKALPSRPLTSIALSDADTETALKYVTWKLSDAGIERSLQSNELKIVGRLGGRISDLDALVNKVRNGQSVTDAVEEIIHRGVSEMRKNAFGDDLEDAKSLPWTREQAWSVLRALAAKDEVQYADVLLDFPFKGDEMALRSMETAELIAIGRPATIKPGKPVYKYVYQRLVEDRVFKAVQDINLNEKLIATSVSTIKTCEDELTMLKSIGLDLGSSVLGGKGATAARANYLLEKMMQATLKVEQLEADNVKLKKVLAKGASN
ncbi:mitochondrial escape protein 2 [Ceratobasidium sp. 370]|nr:mitochondrial escape protein 2 [Ceratobasidium sp. 370]